MTLGGFGRDGAVLGSILVSEAGPSDVVASFDGNKPSGADRKISSGMEIADKGFHAGEIIGVECCERGGGGARRGFRLPFGTEGETPELGARAFTPASQNGFGVWVEDSDRRLCEDDGTIGVAEGSNTNKGVLETREDVDFGGGNRKLG